MNHSIERERKIVCHKVFYGLDNSRGREMLHRAARNAYSWWWASHVRTKQSNWLEQSLQDMEEKVEYILSIIGEEGDSFAQRAEMYYRKRPELLNFIEDCFREYRALAEKFDHLSRELQSANRTIAAVYPERLELAMDDEDEENFRAKSPQQPSKDLPAAPLLNSAKLIPQKSSKAPARLMSKKGLVKTGASGTFAAPASGLTKAEALEEIDKLQKKILGLQTEKEFVKISYESRHTKYWEIEEQVTEMQARVNSLQDEFGVGTFIEDDEARTLMAATALKSCQETLNRLQEKQENLNEEAGEENQKIKEANEKFEILKEEFGSRSNSRRESLGNLEIASKSPESESDDRVRQVCSKEEQERRDMREKIKQQLQEDSSAALTMSELAEKIDELVNKVITLETAASAQNAMVDGLKLETNELQAHLRSLEEDKEALIEDSDSKSRKIRELTQELIRVQNLNQNVQEQNRNLEIRFSEASLGFDHLSEKLQTVKQDEEDDNVIIPFKELKAVPANSENDAKTEGNENLTAPTDGSESSTEAVTKEGEKKDFDNQELGSSVKTEEDNSVQSSPNNLEAADDSLISEVVKIENEIKDDKEADSCEEETELETKVDEEEQPDWTQMFSNGIDEREKILLRQYTSTLRHYKETKKKLVEAERKSRDSLFKSATQIKELRNANASKDTEIQSLVEKLNATAEGGSDEEAASSSAVASPQRKQLSQLLEEERLRSLERTEKSTAADLALETPRGGEEREWSIGRKFRMEIDVLLEENIEFWMRFSTSFHQIKKFQTSVKDLLLELQELREKRRLEGSSKQRSISSDLRPIYKHLKEIQTELGLWLEHNALLEDDLQNRLASLSSIQEEILSLSGSTGGGGGGESELSDYEAAKFQGEILNMKQENKKVACELKGGVERVKELRVKIARIVSGLEEEMGISGAHRRTKSRSRIPLTSFLFGVKLKKQKPSLFQCMSPALQRQTSELRTSPPSS